MYMDPISPPPVMVVEEGVDGHFMISSALSTACHNENFSQKRNKFGQLMWHLEPEKITFHFSSFNLT